jgi:hypothetical protein
MPIHPAHRCIHRPFLFMVSNSKAFTLSDFQAESSFGLINPPSRKRKCSRSKEPFLCGPVPMGWLYSAGSLPGKTLHVSLLLWHEVGCHKSRTIRFHISKARRYGIHLDSARRALKALEAGGLISVRRIPGQCSEVTILDVASSPPTMWLAENRHNAISNMPTPVEL